MVVGLRAEVDVNPRGGLEADPDDYCTIINQGFAASEAKLDPAAAPANISRNFLISTR